MKKALISLLFLLTCANVFAQRYSGVNMNSIRMKKSRGNKGQDKQEPYWQVMGGYGTSLGQKFKTRLPQVPSVFSENESGYYIQLAVKHIWQKLSVQSQINLQEFDDETNLNNSYNRYALDFWGVGLSINYHWIKNGKWLLYSGVVGGYRWGRTTETNNSGDRLRFNWFDYQITALGVNYCPKKWGAFAELSYGTVGIFYAGVLYKFSS